MVLVHAHLILKEKVRNINELINLGGQPRYHETYGTSILTEDGMLMAHERHKG